MFIVVAIIIFGIFVGLTYTLFGSEGLSKGLVGIFDTTIERLDYLFEQGPLKVTKLDNGDGSYTLIAENVDDVLLADSIKLVSQNEGMNLIPNGNFTEDLLLAKAKYDIQYTFRKKTTIVNENMFLDETNKINGQNTLTMNFPEGGISEPYKTIKDVSINFKNYFNSGDPFTFSFYAYANKEIDFKIRLGHPVDTGDVAVVNTVKLTPDVKRYSVTFGRESFQDDGNILMWSEELGSEIHINGLQVEHGTEMSDWKPFSVNENSDGFDGKKLEIVTSKKGTYIFKMIDSKGKEYTEEIKI